jgi:hypothetical protein
MVPITVVPAVTCASFAVLSYHDAVIG